MNNRPLASKHAALDWGAFKIAGLYLLIGGLWILFSDELAAALVSDAAMLTRLSILKGWGYIIITTLLLYWLIQRHTNGLRESEERYGSLFRNNHSIMLLIDPEGGAIVDANPAACAFYGYTHPEITSLKVSDINQLTPEQVFGEMAQAEQEQRHHFFFQHRLAGGEVREVEVYSGPIAFNGKRLLYSIVHDITGRRQAEEQFRLVVEASPSAIMLINAEHRITLVNARAETLFGYTREELIGQPVEMLVPPQIRAHHSQYFDAFIAASEARLIGPGRDLFGWRKDGSQVPVEIGLTPLRTSEGMFVLTTIVDITERKQAEEQIRYQASLTDNVSDAIIATDTNFHITAWNKAAETIYGWSAQEVLGQLSVAVLKTDYTPGQREMYQDRLFAEGQWTDEVIQRRKDGTAINVLASVSLLKDSMGQLVGVVAVNRDITERKQVEEALHKSHENFRLLVEQAPISIAMFDRDMRYLATSRRWIEEYGRGREELTGLCHYDILPDLPPTWAEIHRQGLAGTVVKNDDDLWVWADGSRHWLRWAVHPWRDTAGHIGGILISTEDITEHKRAEEALRMSEERFAKAFRASPDVLAISRQDDERILEVNDNWTVLTGYNRDETIDHTVTELDLYAAPADYRQVMQRLREHGSLRDFEFDLRCKSGAVRQVSLSIEAIVIKDEPCWLSINRDITERKRAEKTIRLKDELLRLTGEMAKVGGWEFDTQTLQGTWTDEVALIHDLDSSQETNVELGLSFYSGESRQKIEQAVQGAVELAKSYDLELEMVSAKGKHKWIRTMGLPILDNGKVVKVRGIFQDITERKEAEDELRQTAAELARSNAELEQFAYIASHDLQEPLRAVTGMLELLQRRYAGQIDDRADEFIRHAVEGASRMQTLITDLLALSRVGTRGQPFQPTDCSTILTTVLSNLMVVIAESGAQVTHDPLPTVIADPTQLGQLFQNLISNGIKFRREDCAPAIHIKVEHKEGEYLFAVHDNGIGMEAQYFERIFGIFQRLHTRREYDGTGIGLAVCKKIVERHGGHIGVESVPGQGSTFYFTLPTQS